MRRKIVWLVVSCLMVLSLLMASCAPAVTEEEEVVAPPKEEKEVVTEEEVAPPPGEPTYGGVMNVAATSSDFGFDDCYIMAHAALPLMLTHEELMTGDWAKGPAGTGEVSWRISPFNPSMEVGCLAESWERPDEETIIFHIRKGVHWQDKPPLNGRELTADDVVYSLNRQFFTDLPFAAISRIPTGAGLTSLEATDKYTVVVKSPAATFGYRLRLLVELMRILAPEPGGPPPGDYREWEKCVGTGPFMVVDYVPSSSVSFVKNPNYWMKDPVHPENTLPYVDEVNILIIPDASTRLAALRAGKIPMLGDLGWEDKDSLIKTNPELKWVGGISGKGGSLIGMSTDREDLPFQYQSVRRALAMGIDRQAIVRDLYGGNAEVLAFPVLPDKAFEDMFIPLEELPESTQELYEYNPEKAKQLLTDAGYPDGFKTPLLCSSTGADMASILKAYWEKIGVDLDVQVKESGSLMGLKFNHGGMYLGGQPADDPAVLFALITGGWENTSMVSDPYIDDIYNSKLERYGYLEWDKLAQVFKEELTPYILEQCWYIDLPAQASYTFWQPWLKGYHGENEVGMRNINTWVIYTWLDQELKKEMTGR